MEFSNPFLSQIRNDSAIANALSGMGEEEVDRSESDYVKPLRLLDKRSLDTLMKDPIINRIVTALPKAALKKPWHLSFGDNDKGKDNSKIISAYGDYHTKLKTKYYLQKADIASRQSGGACVILNVDDGRHYSEPIDRNNIKSIKRLFVRDRNKIRPNLVEEDYLVLDPIHDIESYWIGNLQDRVIRDLSQNGRGRDDLVDFKIHKDRIIRFDGIIMSDDYMLEHEGWSLSVIDSLYPYFAKWDKCLSSIGQIVETASILVYSMKGLSEIVLSEDENLLRARFRTFRLMLSVFGGLTIDSQNEKVDYVTRSFNGLESVANNLKEALIGASGLPHTFIFGESPSGLGATGESESEGMSNSVSDHQDTKYSPAINYLDELIFLAKDGPTSGKLIRGIDVAFPAWKEQSETEKKQDRATDVQTLVTAAQSSFVTADEARTVFSNVDWWPQLQLDKEAWDKKQKEEAVAAADQTGGYDFSQYQDPSQDPSQDPNAQQEQAYQQDSLYSDIDFSIPSTVRKSAKNIPLLRKPFSAREITPDVARKLKTKLETVKGSSKNIAYIWLKDIVNKMDQAESDSLILKKDSASTIKRVVDWQGVKIGITHDPQDVRFNRPMSASYGHIRGTYGQAADKKSHDAYVGKDLESSSVYKVRQLNPDTGEIDEDKYFIGFNSPAHVRNTFCQHAGITRFGGVELCKPEEIESLKSIKLDAESLSPPIPEITQKKTADDWLVDKLSNKLGDAIANWQDDIQKKIANIKGDSEKEKYSNLYRELVDMFDVLSPEEFELAVYQSLVLSELAGRMELLEELKK